MLALTKPLDPTQHLVTVNPTYDQLWAPIFDQLHDAKIPKWHSAVAVMEPGRQLHDLLALALCMMEGLAVAFQGQPPSSANPIQKNEVYAQVTIYMILFVNFGIEFGNGFFYNSPGSF
ncbi:hypothetical protein RHGRI_004693 [Rhododendron griersonianum]|uniref:Chlorophyll a-b binding protein, chloroplastic n=1 Tax=Rhododendron griersonianum TaxID=479676 RepID=A0AAV6L9K2_9ERIC|nr:hypothetical protein RHGRI_004693 [Rhododendron griersonianum]